MKPRQNRVKEQLQAGQSIRCCSLGIPHPTLIEILGIAGFEAVTLDREHSAISIDAMESLLLASEAAEITPFWREGRFDESELRRALDVGYTNFVVPHIHSAADAMHVIRATRYAPAGNRGVGPARPIRYGLDDPREYFKRADENILVALMIEDPDAVEDIENIVAVDGVELVQLGFWDLSVAYGLPFQERHPRLVQAADKVLQAARERGVWVGIPPVSPEDMSYWEEKGARFFEVASLTGLLARAAQSCVQRYPRRYDCSPH